MSQNPTLFPHEPAERMAAILSGLKDPLAATRSQAITALGQSDCVNYAILRALEKIALGDPDEDVRRSALEALKWPLNLGIYRDKSTLGEPVRKLILEELALWEVDGMIRLDHADVLKRRYDFDIISPVLPPQPASVVEEMIAEPIAAPLEIAPVLTLSSVAADFKPDPGLQASAEEKLVEQPLSPAPEPQKTPLGRSVAQALLSEASIRIALFLGAFLVIAAALILAALVQELRLPLLLTTTALFGGTAIALRKRLPLPSFVLFIVFSCLVPISARVIVDNINLAGNANTVYWMGIWLLLTGIWSGSTWFYRSPFFSLCALGAWMGVFFMAPWLLPYSYESDTILALSAAVLLTYPALFALKRWQGYLFSQFTFIAISIVLFVLSLASWQTMLGYAGDASRTLGNLGLAGFFLAGCYFLSQQFQSLFLFPWLAVISFLVIPDAVGVRLDLGANQCIALDWVGGALCLVAGETIHTLCANKKWLIYCLPLQLGGTALLFIAFLWGLGEGNTVWLVSSAASTILLAGVQVRRPRWWIWSAALLASASTYFALIWQFIFIPLHLKPFTDWDGFITLMLFTAALLCLLPELFFAPPWSSQKIWRWPLHLLGWILAFLSLICLAIESYDRPGLAALVLGGYGLFCMFYAFRWNLPILGFFSSGLLALALATFLVYLQLNRWAGPMAAMSIGYFGAGLLLRRSSPTWSQVMRFCGLGLGLILAVLLPYYSNFPERGWIILLIGIMVFIESRLPWRSWFELGVYPFVLLSIVLLFHDTGQSSWNGIVFACALLVFGLEQVFKHLFPKPRPWRELVIVTGAGLGLINTVMLIFGENNEMLVSFLLGVYALVYLGLAFLEKKPRVGYAAAAYLPAALFFFLRYLHIANPLTPLTILGLVYYSGGVGLERAGKDALRASVLRLSGMALGGLVAVMGVAYSGWQVPIAAVCAAAMYTYEVTAYRVAYFEFGIHLFTLWAYFLALGELKNNRLEFYLAGSGILLAAIELIMRRGLKLDRRWNNMPALIGLAAAGIAAIIIFPIPYDLPITGAVILALFALFSLVYALLDCRPWVGYAFAAWVPLAVLSALRVEASPHWLFPLIAIACAYYGAGILLKQAGKNAEWISVFNLSGLALAGLIAISAPFENSGLPASIPVAIAATLVSVEALRRRNVWLGFPATALYLLTYFMILFTLKVEQFQYYTIGAALLGLVMHYLLVRTGSRTAAFITGVISQLVLLSTSYIQMVSTSQLSFFFVLFVQALVVLLYGVVIRSRSLVVTSILFTVLGVVTVVFYMLKGISTVVLLGCTGIILLLLGILAVLARERLIQVGGKISQTMQGWQP